MLGDQPILAPQRGKRRVLQISARFARFVLARVRVWGL